jgi:hypothetical protein
MRQGANPSHPGHRLAEDRAGDVRAEAPIRLELILAEGLAEIGRLVREIGMPSGVLLDVGGFVTRERCLDVDKHAGHLPLIDIVIADSSDNDVRI